MPAPGEFLGLAGAHDLVSARVSQDDRDPKPPRDWSVAGLTMALGIGIAALIMIAVLVWLLFFGPIIHGE